MLRHALKLNWLCLSIFLTVILIGGAPSPSFAAKGPDAAYNFLCGQIKGIGIIDSHVDAFSDSYTYDNALAVIAFTAKGDYVRAGNILNAYKNNIDAPLCGAYYDVYDYVTGVGRGNISAGPNAWLLDAINFYHYKTGDARFVDMAQILADYLVGLQDQGDGGIFGDDYASWKSTEHNLDAYAGLYNYGLLNNKDLYIQKAELIKDFLAQECWNGERFLRGKNDPVEVMDVQSLGVLSLGVNYASAVYWAEYHTKCVKPLGGISVTGFDFNNDLDTVWLEGTLQGAMAFMKNRDDYRAGIYFDNVDRTQYSSGSFLCATNEGTTGTDWILLPIESVAPTCWYLFYATSINPLEVPLKLAAQDTTPPAGAIKINNGATYTASAFVTLNLSAADAPGGSGMGNGSQMQFSNDNVTWSSPEAYATTKSWRLPVVGNGDVDGSGRIFSNDALFALKYSCGRITPSENQFIRADVNGDGNITSQDAWNILNLRVRRTRESLGLPPVRMSGAFTVYVKFKDAAGNWSKTVSDTIIK